MNSEVNTCKFMLILNVTILIDQKTRLSCFCSFYNDDGTQMLQVKVHESDMQMLISKLSQIVSCGKPICIS